jgi:hypothetical protein
VTSDINWPKIRFICFYVRIFRADYHDISIIHYYHHQYTCYHQIIIIIITTSFIIIIINWPIIKPAPFSPAPFSIFSPNVTVGFPLNLDRIIRLCIHWNNYKSTNYYVELSCRNSPFFSADVSTSTLSVSGDEDISSPFNERVRASISSPDSNDDVYVKYITSRFSR